MYMCRTFKFWCVFCAGKAMGFVQLGGVVGKLIMGYVSNLAMRSQVSGMDHYNIIAISTY